jgi:uncharacterized membrane protein required for colicin V production
MTYLFFDVAIVAVLLFFAWQGARRGFILTLCGLLAIIVAIVGANLISGALAPRVADLLEPHFATAIEEHLDQAIQGQRDPAVTPLPEGEEPEEEPLPLQGILAVLRDMGGFYEKAADSIQASIEAGLTQAAADVAASVAANVAQSVARLVIFLLSFAVILVAWWLLSHALNLVAKLPGLSFLNQAAGGLLGLCKGVLLLMLALFLLRLAGMEPPQEAIEQTYLLKLLMGQGASQSLFSGVAS